MTFSKKGPWYKYLRDYFTDASNILVSYNQHAGKIDEETRKTFSSETLASFIFESNNIEQEGLTYGQTREVILFEVPELPTIFPILEAQLLDKTFDPLKRMLKNEIADGLDLKLITTPVYKGISAKRSTQIALGLVAKYGAKQRAAFTVVQHATATLKAHYYERKRTSQQVSKVFYDLYMQAKDVPGLGINEDLKKLFSSIPKAGPRVESLLSEAKIKVMHSLMADGLIDRRYAQAGEYRKHEITTGIDSHYPAPASIPQAMRSYVKRFKEMEHDWVHPILLASWASTEFVRIHPFSDFNGRISRLILNMVLRNHGLPFWLPLRSNKRDKSKYFYSLRNYGRDKKLMSALISMRLVQEAESLNEILEISGYKPLKFEQAVNYSKESLESKNLMKLTWPLYAGYWPKQVEIS